MGIAPQNQRKRLGTIEILQKSDPKPLSTLSSCLGTLKQSWKKQGVITSLWNEWPKIAGEQLAPHTRPISFKHGILIIGASHPQWLQALIYNRPQLLAAIRTNGHKVKDLRIQQYHPKKLKEIEEELDEIKNSQSWGTISELGDNWESYFEDKKSEINYEIQNLQQNEANQNSSESP